jgi:hypothetical protein
MKIRKLFHSPYENAWSKLQKLQKYVPAECKTSYHKSVHEGAEIAQVTAQMPAECGGFET